MKVQLCYTCLTIDTPLFLQALPLLHMSCPPSCTSLPCPSHVTHHVSILLLFYFDDLIVEYMNYSDATRLQVVYRYYSSATLQLQQTASSLQAIYRQSA